MTTHEDNARDAGLTPEERALARRLGKLGPQAEPSPALDARILAAAHAATRQAAPARRKPSRWPATFGFAASLALACGIAWQMRPVPQAPVAAPAAAAVEADEAVPFNKPPPSMSARIVPRRPLNMPTPPPAEPPAPQRRQSIGPATRADAARKPQPFAEPPLVLDEAVHPAPAAPANAAAAAAAPAAPTVAPNAMSGVESTTVLSAEQVASPAPAPAAKAARDVREQRASDAEPQFAEPDEEVVPPATADSPQVRDAWLQRIRELLRDGHVEEARESLHAFRARYPRVVVPEDLRALGE